jgi:hypothetical protein
MSQGTSGDLASMNYSGPAATAEYDRYANELAKMAERLYREIKYERDVPLVMREARLPLRRRVADAARLDWARSMEAKIGDRRPKGWPEIYALEQLMLAAEPQRELKLQAVRIGNLGITAIPNEVFAITGLKLKLQSPLPSTFNVSLANGAEGYIPPPEQHKLGGYTTWAARTAALEVDAEPQIVETLLKLLEEVSGEPRRPAVSAAGAYATEVLRSQPRAYWPLADMAGEVAADASGNELPGRYEDVVARFLPGPVGAGLQKIGEATRAAHLVGGRVRSEIPGVGNAYSIELWFWNGLSNDLRPVTGYLFSRGPDGDTQARGDHLGIGGTHVAAGRLFFFNGNALNEVVEGRTSIEAKTWNHLVLTRSGDEVRLYLNGGPQPEISATAAVDGKTAGGEWFFGGRNDRFATLEGKLAQVAVYDRVLEPEEVARHYAAAALPVNGR